MSAKSGLYGGTKRRANKVSYNIQFGERSRWFSFFPRRPIVTFVEIDSRIMFPLEFSDP